MCPTATAATTMEAGIMVTVAAMGEGGGIGTITRMVVMRIAEITVGRIVPGVVGVVGASRSRR